MKILLKYSCFIFTGILSGTSAFAQVSITGPQCVMAGTVYQYTIQGNWDSSSTMQVCISSGTIADSAGTHSCTGSGGAPLATVLVKWNGSASDAGAISLTSTKGSSTLSVNFAGPLLPGSIDSMSKTQIIAADSIPSAINCSADKGGSCSPSYSDQWQQSPDMVSWTDIAGANGQDLSFSSPPVQTTFYRRKVTETVSGTIAYSDEAVVNVEAKGITTIYMKFNDISGIIGIAQKRRSEQILNYLNK